MRNIILLVLFLISGFLSAQTVFRQPTQFLNGKPATDTLSIRVDSDAIVINGNTNIHLQSVKKIEFGDPESLGNGTKVEVVDSLLRINLRSDSGVYFGNVGTPSIFRILSNDTTRITSTLPIKIGNGSLIISATGFIHATSGAKIDGALINPPQYAVPTTGQTVTSNGNSQLVVNPAGTLLALTIAFPTSPVDGQQFNISSTQILTGLTLTSAQTILGPLTTIAAANGYAGWVYSATATSWIRTR